MCKGAVFGGRQQRTSHSSRGPSSQQFHTKFSQPGSTALHNESENKHRSGDGGGLRALTWRRLVVQRGGVQGQAEARAGQAQLTQQDPHAASTSQPALTARTHSLLLGCRARRRCALLGGRCVTEAGGGDAGAYIAPPDVTPVTSPP